MLTSKNQSGCTPVQVTEAARADALGALAKPGVAADVVAFYNGALAWFDWLEKCAPALPYPGPFENPPTVPAGPYGFGSAGPKAGSFAAAAPATGADAPAAVPADGGSLAHTGAESSALAFFGAGMVGFGALALGARRRLA